MMQLRARFSLPGRLLSGFSLHGALRRAIVRSTDRYPRTWMTFSVMVAGVGYGFLVFFPYLFITMARTSVPEAFAAQTTQDWLALVPQICAMFIGAVFTIALCSMRFAPPAGTVLAEEDAPHLFGLVDRLGKAYGKPRICRIILDQGDDVRVVKTPRTGFPLFNTTSLVIGLPVLLTVSPPHFRVLLARRVGQLSSRETMISSWLFHLRSVWPQFRDQHRRNALPARMMGHFFALFAPLYNTLTLGLCRREEINADHHAHNIINEEEVAAAISCHAAGRNFLVSRYWPAIQQMAARRPDYLPYDHMTTIASKNLTSTGQAPVMHRLLNEDDIDSKYPTLADRLEHLGHIGPPPLKFLKTTAAQLFLDKSLATIVKDFDKRWLKRSAAHKNLRSSRIAVPPSTTRRATRPAETPSRSRFGWAMLTKPMRFRPSGSSATQQATAPNT